MYRGRCRIGIGSNQNIRAAGMCWEGPEGCERDLVGDHDCADEREDFVFDAS